MEKILIGLSGVIFIYGGIQLIVNKSIPHSLQIDFEGFALPLGSLSIILGVALLIITIRKN